MSEEEAQSMFEKKERFYQESLSVIEKLLKEHEKNCKPNQSKDYVYKLESLNYEMTQKLYQTYKILQNINEVERLRIDHAN